MFNFFRREVTPERFAQQVIQRMKRVGAFSHPVFDQAQFCLRFDTEYTKGRIFNLHNVYRDYQKESKKSRDALIDKYLEAFKQPPTELDREASLSQLLPLIRERSAFENTMLSALAGDKDAKPTAIPFRSFYQDYCICLAIDSENSVSIVTEVNLASWGLNFDQALELAIGNLRDRTAEPNFRTNGKGVFISAWTDIFDASRLLLTDMLYRLPIDGDPVIAIPSRNHLFVTGSRDVDGIREIVDFAVDILSKDTRPLAPFLFVCRNERWERLDQSAYATEKLSVMAATQWGNAYEDQKKLLASIYARENRDVFVASYTVRDIPGYGVSGTTQWTRGVEALLPKVDHLLLFCLISKELIVVSWADVEEVVGAFEAEPGLYPERFQVRGFPSEEQLDALRSRALRVGAASA